ncbi:immediate early protein [Murid herpesvirus 3]|uniref:Immediate early protein n=2 Tax=Murid betaherpesvirus 3 TaxID=2560603 RepID=A0A1P8VIR9_9BETA|nr:immediate early protein [Murine roseolovirus]APZ76244.1 immediate early protein [Murid betaherpesvirus 3]AYH64785.1 immediate early protein [Murid herpesvirus 3]
MCDGGGIYILNKNEEEISIVANEFMEFCLIGLKYFKEVYTIPTLKYIVNVDTCMNQLITYQNDLTQFAKILKHYNGKMYKWKKRNRLESPDAFDKIFMIFLITTEEIEEKIRTGECHLFKYAPYKSMIIGGSGDNISNCKRDYVVMDHVGKIYILLNDRFRTKLCINVADNFSDFLKGAVCLSRRHTKKCDSFHENFYEPSSDCIHVHRGYLY